MIARPAGGLRGDVEAQLFQIKSIDKGVDHPHRIVCADRLVKTLRKQRRLIAIPALHKPLHACPRLQLGNRSMLRENAVPDWPFHTGSYIR